MRNLRQIVTFAALALSLPTVGAVDMVEEPKPPEPTPPPQPIRTIDPTKRGIQAPRHLRVGRRSRRPT